MEQPHVPLNDDSQPASPSYQGVLAQQYADAFLQEHWDEWMRWESESGISQGQEDSPLGSPQPFHAAYETTNIRQKDFEPISHAIQGPEAGSKQLDEASDIPESLPIFADAAPASLSLSPQRMLAQVSVDSDSRARTDDINTGLVQSKRRPRLAENLDVSSEETKEQLAVPKFAFSAGDSTTTLRQSIVSQPQIGLSGSSSSSSPEASLIPENRKRKLQVENTLEARPPYRQHTKKAAHNVIEKRYRRKLNDQIATLRDCVPSLRIASRYINGDGDDVDGMEDLEGLTPAHKLNKATVLSRATEYIQYLEKRNKTMAAEMAALNRRLNALEKLNMAGLISMNSHSKEVSQENFEDTVSTSVARQTITVTSSEARGMIPIPENVRRLQRLSVNQEHYAPAEGHNAKVATVSSGERSTEEQLDGNNRRTGGLMTKVVVGSLASFMIVEGFHERENSQKEPSGRGLFSFPTQFLNWEANSTSLALFDQRLFPLIKACLVFTALVYLLFSFVNTRGYSKKLGRRALSLNDVSSPGSSTKIRKEARHSTVETVWIPPHNMLLELAALLLAVWKLSIIRLIGQRYYAFLLGAKGHREEAISDAWDCTVQAQLAGGDVDISDRRLLFTLLASGTLPHTPSRLMLKALHAKILLSAMAKASRGSWLVADMVLAKLVNCYWEAARLEQMSNSGSSNRRGTATERLPSHLAFLLLMNCDAVFTEAVVDHAYRLAWNNQTTSRYELMTIMDAVTRQTAVDSPLDRLAGWWSSYRLDDILKRYIDLERPFDLKELDDSLQMAICAAAPGSIPLARALAAKAVLLDHGREAHISAACSALPAAPTAHLVLAPSSYSTSMNDVRDTDILTDIRVALTFAKCLSLIEHGPTEGRHTARHRAIAMINGCNFPVSTSNTLSFLAAYRALIAFAADTDFRMAAKPGLAVLADSLGLWIGGEPGWQSGIGNEARGHILKRCLDLSVSLAGLRSVSEEEYDTGYGSQSDSSKEAQG